MPTLLFSCRVILVHKVTLETQESLDHRSVFNFNNYYY